MGHVETVQTVQTMLDLPHVEAPILAIAGCQYCNPEITENGLCDPCWEAIEQRIAALLATPGVVAILAHVDTLTATQRQKLEKAYLANFQIHRVTHSHLHHRVAKAYGSDWRDLNTAPGRVWKAFHDRWQESWPAHAAQDAAYAYLAGDLLSADERRLFIAPWTDVVQGIAHATVRGLT
jgi:hypothetical protein